MYRGRGGGKVRRRLRFSGGGGGASLLPPSEGERAGRACCGRSGHARRGIRTFRGEGRISQDICAEGTAKVRRRCGEGAGRAAGCGWRGGAPAAAGADARGGASEPSGARDVYPRIYARKGRRRYGAGGWMRLDAAGCGWLRAGCGHAWHFGVVRGASGCFGAGCGETRFLPPVAQSFALP